MCLNVPSYVPVKRATKDIVCWKICCEITDNLCRAKYTKYLYQTKIVYKNPGDFDEFLNWKKNLIFNKQIPTEKKKEKKFFDFTYGFHSYRKRITHRLISSSDVWCKFIIPKGSCYIAWDGYYVSNKIVFVKIMPYRDSDPTPNVANFLQTFFIK